MGGGALSITCTLRLLGSTNVMADALLTTKMERFS